MKRWTGATINHLVILCFRRADKSFSRSTILWWVPSVPNDDYIYIRKLCLMWHSCKHPLDLPFLYFNCDFLFFFKLFFLMEDTELFLFLINSYKFKYISSFGHNIIWNSRYFSTSWGQTEKRKWLFTGDNGITCVWMQEPRAEGEKLNNGNSR